ncbi:Rpn family recombination-promoting nuclease/putative transposase, partial [Salmonella enterica]|nr:Rpn family recombination-promoting nuclease/putative transposase [Salmonella enterica]
FVEDDLRQYFSDVLYSLKTTAGDGYIHVLVEHQSTPDKHMAFRLIRYAVAAMQRHLEAGHKKLPLVIPVLFYTGKRSPYPYSTRWLDEFDDPGLAGKLYSGAFPLVDVTVIPDDEIAGHRSMAALTLLQKHIHQRDLAELVDRLAPILLAGYLSSSQVISLVHYIVQAGETSDAEAFVRELAQRVPQHGDALMTIAQQLEQKGIEKGIQLGEQRGIEKGRSEGEREATLKIARTMLQNGIDRNTVMKMTGLTEDDLAQIRH